MSKQIVAVVTNRTVRTPFKYRLLFELKKLGRNFKKIPDQLLK